MGEKLLRIAVQEPTPRRLVRFPAGMVSDSSVYNLADLEDSSRKALETFDQAAMEKMEEIGQILGVRYRIVDERGRAFGQEAIFVNPELVLQGKLRLAFIANLEVDLNDPLNNAGVNISTTPLDDRDYSPLSLTSSSIHEFRDGRGVSFSGRLQQFGGQPSTITLRGTGSLDQGNVVLEASTVFAPHS